MQRLPQEAINLLRALIDVIEPEALRYIVLTVQGTVKGALCPTPVTDRPSEPLLPVVSGGGHLLWRPQLIVAQIPCPGWFVQFQGHPLRQQLAATLLRTLPATGDEESQRFIESAAPHSVDSYINATLHTYLSLLLGTQNRELAFRLAAEQLEVRFDPDRAHTYVGCFLYNFWLDDPHVEAVTVADDVTIRKSVFADVARFASFEALDSNFLPPPYMLVRRVDHPGGVAFNILGGGAGNADEAEEIDNTIAVLRLLRTDYVGRGTIFGWTEGPPSSLGRPAPPPSDAVVAMVNRGDDPEPARPVPAYRLTASDIGDAKRLLACVRKLVKTDTSVTNAIRLLGTREGDWVNLYKVLEIVKGDVGRKIIDNGWASKKILDRFTNTANTSNAIGDDARHAADKFQPPAVPMTLPEARALIASVVMRWVEPKC